MGKKITFTIVLLVAITFSGFQAMAENKTTVISTPQRNITKVTIETTGEVVENEVSMDTPKIAIFITEQNIEGPQRRWWASEIDLSASESAIAQNLSMSGFDVIDIGVLKQIIKQKPAFRKLELSEVETIEIAELADIDYIVVGKATASSGGNVPQSNMISCFGNLTAKLIRIEDGKVIGYLQATGSSAHLDKITGGTEALVKAGNDVALKIMNILAK